MRRARPATHGVSVPARMRLTAAELTEIRHAFRQRLATERVPEKPARRKQRLKPPSRLVRDPEHDDTCILTPALVAELFAVSPRTVRRLGRLGGVASFRTVAVSVASGGERSGAWSPNGPVLLARPQDVSRTDQADCSRNPRNATTAPTTNSRVSA
jgi:hypothetical protein